MIMLSGGFFEIEKTAIAVPRPASMVKRHAAFVLDVARLAMNNDPRIDPTPISESRLP